MIRQWQVRDEDWGEGETWTMEASTAGAAAEDFTEQVNIRMVEYPLVRTVIVQGGGEVKTFEVEMYNDPIYTARPKR